MSSYHWGRNKLFLLIAQLHFGHFSDIFTANSFSMFNSNILKFLQMQDFPAITNIECLSPGCKVSGTNGLRVIVKWRGRTQRRPTVCIGRSAHGIRFRIHSTRLLYKQIPWWLCCSVLCARWGACCTWRSVCPPRWTSSPRSRSPGSVSAPRVRSSVGDPTNTLNFDPDPEFGPIWIWI